jgi:hypothetical protein
VTTGVPIYLVSACASAEEFVAAFRRYADKTGLFIPMAEPLPAGRTGRLALTLADGGVMIEGVAQIVTSSAKPLGLYGRPGITVKFTEPDNFSKQVIADLEKARLALRPLPPSVPPRKAEVPAEPRPKPPAIVGRIDAANALAETVAIGDLAQLEVVAGDANASGGMPKAGQKFVVPSIPNIGGSSGSGPTRAKTPTAPPEGRAKSPTTPPEGRPKSPTTPPPEARPKSPTKPPLAEPRAKTPTKPPPADARPKSPTGPPSSAGLALADALKAADPPKPPERTRPPTKPPPTPPAAAAPPLPGGKRKTMLGMPIVDKLPVEKLTATPPPGPKATQQGMPPMKVTSTQPLPLVPPAEVQGAELKQTTKAPAPAPAPAPTRAKSATRPPRHPTPAAPLPVARLPARGAPPIAVEAVDIATESTDITTVPEPALPERDTVEQSAASAIEEKKEEARPQRSGGMRASEIMAAIPTDDWTMSPDQSAPVVLPSSEKIAKTEDKITIEAKTVPKGPPTGDWTMQADPEAPDGWGAPSKVSKQAPPPETAAQAAERAATGNPVHSVSSKKELDVQEWEDKPTGIGQPLVEIDSTLMEPLKPMPLFDEQVPAPPAVAQTGVSPVLPAHPHHVRAQTGPVQLDVPPPLVGNMARGNTGPAPVLVPTQQPQAGFDNVGTPPPLAPPPLAPQQMNPSYSGPMPQATGQQHVYPQFDPNQQMQMMGFPRQVSDAGTGFFRDSEQVPRFPTDAQDQAERQRRKKVLFIAVGSAVAAVALVVLIIMLTGGKKTAAGNVTKPQTIVMPGSGSSAESNAGSAVEAVKTPEPTPTPETPPTPTPEQPAKTDTCKVEVKSDPPGAQISVDKDTLGTTPATIDLPCGTETKLKIYKQKYFGVVKPVTPTAEGAKVDVALATAIFTVKVTSAPAGATITVGGKPMGVTPTTIKLPAFSASTIVITKDGFTPDTQKITPKQNGMAHHVPLKKLSVQKPPTKR